MKDALVIVGLGILIVVVLAGIFWGIAAIMTLTISLPACNNFSDLNTELDTQFTFWNGCMIYAEEEGLWIHRDDYLNFVSIRGKLDD